jgi:nucleoside-diphosphate-sugar epimerase
MDNTQGKVVLLTGANGFIGSHLLVELKKLYPQWRIKTISRRPVTGVEAWLSFEDFKNSAIPAGFFSDVNQVVHLAAVAHKKTGYDLGELEDVNVAYLEKLLSYLENPPTEKIIFLSSFAVSLLEKNILLDTFAYAEAKKRAEQALHSFGKKRANSFEIVVLRPPMVYGKGAPGNFATLVRFLALPIPLPFKSFRSPRTSIHVKNLTSAIRCVLESPVQKGISTFEISDPWRESLYQFLSDLKHVISGKAKLIAFPPAFLALLLRVIKKEGLYEKLALETHIDNSPFLSRYSWNPPIRFEERFNDLR